MYLLLLPLIFSLPVLLKTAVDKISREAVLEIFSLELPTESLPNQTREPLRTEKRAKSEEDLEKLLEEARALLE